MSCDDRNQDLLLLAHGELGGIRRTLAEHHLRHCSACQERRQRYGALSSVIAGEIRPREMPAWSPHTTSSESAQLSARRLALCVALAILLGVAATAGAVWTPGYWWSLGAWNKQSQTIDTGCLPNAPANAPANVPHSPSKQPSPLPAGNHPAPAANVPTASEFCPGNAPALPRR